MDRYTRKDADRAFARLCDALGKYHGKVWAETDNPQRHWVAKVGAWSLDYAPIYGGVVVEEIVTGGGGVTHPLGESRRSPREFCAMVNFALRVLDEYTALDRWGDEELAQ